jgi:cytochrome o ubiquinol oxidase operon protein cyoD
MSYDSHVVVSKHETDRGTLTSYVTGFGLSVLLTLVAYLFVTHHIFSGWTLFAAIVGLALVQFAVQLVCFLHLGRETKPRWKSLAFSFMILIVAILVLGSLWIMTNLNYHMMSSPTQVNQYLKNQDGGV